MKYAWGKNPKSHPHNSLDRLLLKVKKTEGCWYWTGKLDRLGYGVTSYKGKFIRAHQLSYKFFVGEVPSGLELDHLCKNRPCINPNHLEAVTHKVNTLRSDNPCAINSRKTTCRNGHALSGSNVRIYKRKSATERVCITCNKERSSSFYYLKKEAMA